MVACHRFLTRSASGPHHRSDADRAPTRRFFVEHEPSRLPKGGARGCFRTGACSSPARVRRLLQRLDRGSRSVARRSCARPTCTYSGAPRARQRRSAKARAIRGRAGGAVGRHGAPSGPLERYPVRPRPPPPPATFSARCENRAGSCARAPPSLPLGGGASAGWGPAQWGHLGRFGASLGVVHAWFERFPATLVFFCRLTRAARRPRESTTVTEPDRCQSFPSPRHPRSRRRRGAGRRCKVSGTYKVSAPLYTPEEVRLDPHADWRHTIRDGSPRQSRAELRLS